MKQHRSPHAAGAATLLVVLSAWIADSPGAAAAATSPSSAAPLAGPRLSDDIVPLAGTWPPGFVNPGPFVPFGMVQPGPDTEGPLNFGGYSYQNTLITGFSHIHMSAGVPKAGQIPIMPIAGALTPGDLAQAGYPGTVPGYASPFSHATETARAGYYEVNLLRYDIRAEVTATERAALHRYTYRLKGQAPRLVIAPGRDLAGTHPAAAVLRSDRTLTGFVQTGDNYKVFFAAKFSAPFTAQTLAGAPLVPGQPVQADDLGLLLDFTALNGPLLVKIGISLVDADGALGNLDAEISGWDFDAVRARAAARWDEALARITVTGGTLPGRQSFYTALSRAQQFPNLLSDVDGRYPGPDDRIHQGERPHYSQFSLWDSYRGQNQLLAEIVPDVYRDMIASLLDFQRQSGVLPRWQQAQRDAGHMSGDPAIPFIVDGICRKLVAPAQEPELIAAMQSLADRRAAEIQHGYSPVPPPASLGSEIRSEPRQAGTTLEYGVADFALALAVRDSSPAAADALAQRALNYRNLVDRQTGFIRPRLADGTWLTPFRPELHYGFQEGTSWQYSWLAMHDYAGLIARMGGADRVQRRLDRFFGLPLDAAPLAVPTLQNTITAFGTEYYGNQYAPGNEHDLEAPYVYSYAGAPWKSALTARTAASIYTPTPQGLPGNDDLGALSGWLVWTMLGVYPVNPGTPLYLIGSPHFTSATVHRAGGDFTIAAPGASALHPFVVGAALDGAASGASWFVLPRAATTLDLVTGALPDLNWGAARSELPPSLSTHPLETFGCRR